MPQQGSPEGWSCQGEDDVLGKQQVRMIKMPPPPAIKKLEGCLGQCPSRTVLGMSIFFCTDGEARTHHLMPKEFSFLKTSIMVPTLVFKQAPDVTCEHHGLELRLCWYRAQQHMGQLLLRDHFP